jgi:ABC-type polysaccharide/polyol phosphate transport system ATPase subunit
MTGVVNGFRWALLGTGNGPDITLVDLCCHFSVLIFISGFSTLEAWKRPLRIRSNDRDSDSSVSKNLGKKRYQIGAAESKFRYNMLRDVIMDTVYAPVRIAKALVGKSERRSNQNFVWALDDVSFDLEEGKVLGIVGRNGAGKSTLLKILSRVTEPTKGTVTVRGRVGSLLEVGTGFHPELSGRENIYMNGAILGMKRAEIDKKFDEMVDFSEVGQFIDTPVKRYSSGMYLRLAFAVAAHLEPEILVVDEVLAVGDAEFQRKCLGKMNDVAQQGRTVLFVSHNMSAILRLTQEAIVLKKGQLIKRAPTAEAVDFYLSSGQAESGQRVWEADDVPRRATLLDPYQFDLKIEAGRSSIRSAPPSLSPSSGNIRSTHRHGSARGHVSQHDARRIHFHLVRYRRCNNTNSSARARRDVTSAAVKSPPTFSTRVVTRLA